MLALTVSIVCYVPRSFSLFPYLRFVVSQSSACPVAMAMFSPISYGIDRTTFVFMLCIASPLLRFWRPVWRIVVTAFTSWWHLRSLLKEFWCRQFCPKTTPPRPSMRGCSASYRYSTMKDLWVKSNNLWTCIDKEYIPDTVFHLFIFYLVSDLNKLKVVFFYSIMALDNLFSLIFVHFLHTTCF